MAAICVSAVGDHWVVQRGDTDRVLCICGSRERAIGIGSILADRENLPVVLNEPRQLS